MSEFWIYFEIGVRHFLSRNAYEPFLFLMALSIPFAFKDWKKLLILATVFSVSFAIALLLSIYGMVLIKPEITDPDIAVAEPVPKLCILQQIKQWTNYQKYSTYQKQHYITN